MLRSAAAAHSNPSHKGLPQRFTYSTAAVEIEDADAGHLLQFGIGQFLPF